MKILGIAVIIILMGFAFLVLDGIVYELTVNLFATRDKSNEIDLNAKTVRDKVLWAILYATCLINLGFFVYFVIVLIQNNI